MRVFALILMLISISLRLILVINNIYIAEFNFLGVVIPFDFLIFVFAIIIFAFYTDNKIIERKIKKVIELYGKYKNIKTGKKS